MAAILLRERPILSSATWVPAGTQSGSQRSPRPQVRSLPLAIATAARGQGSREPAVVQNGGPSRQRTAKVTVPVGDLILRRGRVRVAVGAEERVVPMQADHQAPGRRPA